MSGEERIANSNIEAALTEARWLLSFLHRLGMLKAGVERRKPGDRHMREMIKFALENPRHLISLADGSYVADPENSDLDSDQRDYLLRLLAQEPPPPARRRGPPSNGLRDQCIVAVVERLRQDYRLNPTRNRASTARLTACSIVARVLAELGFKLNEIGVETVWGRQRPEDTAMKLPREIGLDPEDEALVDARLGAAGGWAEFARWRGHVVCVALRAHTAVADAGMA